MFHSDNTTIILRAPLFTHASSRPSSPVRTLEATGGKLHTTQSFRPLSGSPPVAVGRADSPPPKFRLPLFRRSATCRTPRSAAAWYRIALPDDRSAPTPTPPVLRLLRPRASQSSSWAINATPFSTHCSGLPKSSPTAGFTGSSTEVTKFVLCPVVESSPARFVVRNTGHS